MTLEQLHKIIQDKNEQREEHTVRTAANLIDRIVSEQRLIADAEARIKELRAELVTLQVEQLDSAAVLGE